MIEQQTALLQKDHDGPAVAPDHPRLDLGEVLAEADPHGAYGDAEPTSPPLIGPDGRVRLSFSRVDTYRTCPLQFRYSYIDQLPSEPRTYLSFGTSIHNALERFHERTLFGMPSEDELLQFLYNGWDSTGYHDVPRDRQVDDYRRAQAVLRRYHRRVADHYRPAAETEKWFEAPVGDHAVIVGLVDRIDVDDHGAYHVVDYKTGKLRDQQQVAKSLQLSLYALAIEHLFGVLPATVSLDFVVAGTEVKVPIEDLDLARARTAVDEVARGVLDSQFAPTPTNLCNWCDYRALCPAWEGEGPDVLGAAVLELRRARSEARRAAANVRALESAVGRLHADLQVRGLDPVVPAPSSGGTTTDGSG